jgi:signal transduction histidine kinase
MSTGSHAEPESAIARQQRFVAETFHVLGQPLTALRCSLELALLSEATGADEYRAALKSALFHTDRVLEAATYARELAEAEDPGNCRPTDVASVIRTVVQEFEPVAESLGLSIVLVCDAGLVVYADADRLQRVTFRLLDALAHGARTGSRITVAAIRQQDSVEITFSAVLNRAPDAVQRRVLKLADRIFRAVGGTVATNTVGNRIELKCLLPAPDAR